MPSLSLGRHKETRPLNLQNHTHGVGLDSLLCPSFHGATLLSLLLNNHDEISCLGDTIPSRARDTRCSCGALVHECDFWRRIEQRTGAARYWNCGALLPSIPFYFGAPRFHRFGTRIVRIVEGRSRSAIGIAGDRALGTAARELCIRATQSLLGSKNSAGREFLDLYRRFYDGVRELQGTSRFIDGSKGIGKLLALRKLAGDSVPTRVIHLVRDPRAYFGSMRKNIGLRDPVSVARIWRRMHLAIEALGGSRINAKYIRLRYEDLCGDPTGTMNTLFRFLDLPDQNVCTAPRDPNKHHLIGNKMLRTFDGTIRLDTSWRRRLDAAETATVFRITESVARRYGYSLED